VRSPRLRRELLDVLNRLDRVTGAWGATRRLAVEGAAVERLTGDGAEPGVLGRVLRDRVEADAVGRVRKLLEAVLAESGAGADDLDIRAHPGWPAVLGAVVAARALLETPAAAD
jgi:hypothetical protein